VHKVACSELNPFGTGSLHGYGLSATLVGLTPRPQYVETCNVPNYAL
jgi:hypothetical protein